MNRQRFSLIAIGLLLWLGLATPAHAQPALIPEPAQVHYTHGWLELGPGTLIVVPADSSSALLDTAGVLRDELQERLGLTSTIRRGAAPAAGAIVLAADGATERPADESYTLEIGRNAEIHAATVRGVLWGAQTLLQSIEARDGGFVLRRGTIADRPVRAWRALMLDPARSFLSLDFLRRTIRVMSAYKLNVLHLHLTDDQGWRFQSKRFPKCTPPGEPCYSQDELRALVAFAARYGVEIVPEFDFPGHSRAAIAAYPELDCSGQARGVDDAILCCGKPFTWTFIDGIVAEAATVFTSPYIHLGADEPFALRRWADCPDCQQRMKDKGVTTLAGLYHTFVLDLDAIVRRHGKRMIVWNDAFRLGVEPAPTPDITIDAWRDSANAAEFARAGFPLINSSSGPLYLTSFGLRGGLPLPAVLAWNATRFAAAEPKRGAATVAYAQLPDDAALMGGQACAWATEQGMVERRLYPRLLAVADSLWAEPRTTDIARFEARLHPAHDRLLRSLGVGADEAQPIQVLFEGKDSRPSISAGAPDLTSTPDGLVARAGPARGWLRTQTGYRNFILTFERWSPTETDATGVFVGCDPSRPPGDTPDGWEISAAAMPGFPATRSLHPPRQWARYEFVARSGIVTLSINGRLAWSVADHRGAAGAIALAGAGGDRFRAIRVRPLAETLP